jgi:hypothetical protein
MIRFASSDALAFAEHLDGQALAALGRARRITDHRAALMERRIAANAPHDTGAYAASFRTETDVTGEGLVRATVGTDDPAGFRHERGFHGTDSLGRNFTQDHGHPHVGPAADFEEHAYPDTLAGMVDEL